MSLLDGIDLVRVVLGDRNRALSDAAEIYQDALSQQADPLRYVIARFGIPEIVATARAAQWAGLVWDHEIPDVAVVEPVHNVERLGDLRSVRIDGPNGPIRYLAARAHDFVRLREQVLGDPACAERYVVVPVSVLHEWLARTHAHVLTDAARHRLALRWPEATAHLDVTMPVRALFTVFVFALMVLTALSPLTGPSILIGVSLVIVVAPALLRLAALQAVERWTVPREARPTTSVLPVYSIVLPMRDEAVMVPQMMDALRALDYPPEKLDFVFVVEADCPRTLEAVARQTADPRVRLVPVPPAAPRTKPKAMNYALPLLRGEFVVVYDAEDRPEPDQLWRAVARFAADPALVCLQAELVIDNPRKTPLTAIFAGEYAGLFGIFLPALARWRLPVPLGGTSNHFRLDTLVALGGWDSFNVTEDADLGMRLARLGHKVGTLASATYEEAPETIAAWMRQRTRWIKGWMQTYLVHNRRPRQLLHDLGMRGFIFFQAIVLGMILAPLLHLTFITSATLRLLAGQPLVLPAGHWLAVLYFMVFCLGLFAAIAIQAFGLLRLGRYGSVFWQLLLPLYWLLLAAATLRALWELLVNPFYWAKTSHRPLAETHAKTGAQAVKDDRGITRKS